MEINLLSLQYSVEEKINYTENEFGFKFKHAVGR